MNDHRLESNQNQKINIKMENVQETLLLPLWGRAVETGKKHPLLEDKSAVMIIDQLDYDFSTIAANMKEVIRVSWIARSLVIDRMIKKLLSENPQATIVNIGCGFDTTFYRVDNGKLTWYDLDLPDVMEWRKKFVPENSRVKCIAGSFLDDEWLVRLATERKGKILFVLAGVLCYFDEYQIKDFFMKIADSFPESEMVFDAFSPKAIQLSNKMVLRDGGMDENAMLKWGLKKAKDIELWDRRFRVLEEYPIYKNMRHFLTGRDKIISWISDVTRMLYMVHIKFCSGNEA